MWLLYIFMAFLTYLVLVRLHFSIDPLVAILGLLNEAHQTDLYKILDRFQVPVLDLLEDWMVVDYLLFLLLGSCYICLNMNIYILMLRLDGCMLAPAPPLTGGRYDGWRQDVSKFKQVDLLISFTPVFHCQTKKTL